VLQVVALIDSPTRMLLHQLSPTRYICTNSTFSVFNSKHIVFIQCEILLFIVVYFFLYYQGGENNVAIDLIVRHVRTQLEQVRLSVESFGCFTSAKLTILSTQNNIS